MCDEDVLGSIMCDRDVLGSEIDDDGINAVDEESDMLLKPMVGSLSVKGWE